jgi:hypothetical protein
MLLQTDKKSKTFRIFKKQHKVFMKKNIIFTAIAAFAIGGLLGGFIGARSSSNFYHPELQPEQIETETHVNQ